MKLRPYIAVLACAALLAACSGESSKPAAKKAAAAPKPAAEKPAALSDPADVAKEFLQAFKAKDIEKVKKLSTPIMRMAAWGDADNVKHMYDSWGDDVAKWDGKIKEVRYGKGMMPYEKAFVYFTDVGKDMDRIVTLDLNHFQSKDWAFDTFATQPRKDFLKLSKTPLEK